MSAENTFIQKDYLTGFHYRQYLNEYLLKAIKSTSLKDDKVSLLLIDIDYFKKINDKYGHACGDEALKHFAHIIKGALEGSHFVARYGGDEFLIVIENKNEKFPVILAKEIKSAIRNNPLVYKNILIPIRFSAGISTFPIDSQKTNELIELADKALYHAKKHGRNKIIVTKRAKLFYIKRGLIINLIKIIILVILIFINFMVYKHYAPIILQNRGSLESFKLNLNYKIHSLIFKYNYCVLEAKDGKEVEGWVIREDVNNIYLSSKPYPFSTPIERISKDQIKSYIKIFKKDK